MSALTSQLTAAITEASYKNPIDDAAFQYALQNLSKAELEGVVSQMEKYRRLSERESDPFMKLFYEYRMYHSPIVAKNLVYQFYNRELRNNVRTESDYLGDQGGDLYELIGDNSGSTQFVAFSDVEYDNAVWTSAVSSSRSSPERNVEVADLLKVLLESDKLREMKKAPLYVLLARLYMGQERQTGRARVGNRIPMDVPSLLGSSTPKEYYEVEQKFQEIMTAFNLEADEVTLSMLLRGHTANNSMGEEVRVKGLTYGDAVKKANDYIEAAVAEIAGSDDIDAIRKFFLQEAKDRAGVSMNTIIKITVGGSVKTSELITTLVYLVDLNLRKKTAALMSPIFRSKNVREIATRLLKTYSRPETKIFIQNLATAPAFEHFYKTKKLAAMTK